MVSFFNILMTSMCFIGGSSVYGWRYPVYNSEFGQNYGNFDGIHGINNYARSNGQQSNFAQYSYGGQGSKGDASGYSTGYGNGVNLGYGNIYGHGFGY